MLAEISSTGLPALRIAGLFLLAVHILGSAYLFRSRHRFFGRDPDVPNDTPVVRHMRVEVVLIPWFGLTSLLLVLLITFWRG